MQFRFKLYRPAAPAPLADVLPILEHMGLRALIEDGFPIARRPARPVWVHEFLIEDAARRGPCRSRRRQRLRGRLRRASGPASRERRLQPAGAGAGRLLARGGADPRAGPLPPADRARSRRRRCRRRRCRTTPRSPRLILRLFAISSIRRRARTRSARGQARSVMARDQRGAAGRSTASTPTGCCAAWRVLVEATKRTNYYQLTRGQPSPTSASRSPRPRARRTCRRPSRSARSSSGRRTSRACTCASARWRAAACAGRTGATTSAPRCWGW